MQKKQYAIGIDIGGTNTVAGLVAKSGECNGKQIFRTENYDDVNLFIDELVKHIKSLQANLQSDEE
ncbi:MAG: ROK family protein, partial [FCB group bacterium]